MVRDLRDKLRRNMKKGAAPAASRGVPSGAGLREYLNRRRERAQQKRVRVELPPGEECSNEAGAFWMRRERYPLTSLHGDHPLSIASKTDWKRIAELAKDEGFRSVKLRECVFLDTETTGLSGGAGTTVFLTGLAFLEKRSLIVEQIFLRTFDEEPGALTHVAKRLREHPLQVTFVGKCFDRHRLASRMTMHRVESNVLDPRHLDLLYLSRRAWGQELPDTRLRTLEEERLGLFREDDLPGSEAPAAWLDWLRDGDGPVDRVLEHNRLDVLSLVTLLGVLGAG